MEKNTNSNIVSCIFGAIFIFAGLGVALIMLLYAKVETRRVKEWTPTQAIIQDITKSTYRRKGKTKTDYDVYIAYVYNGREYTGELDDYRMSMDIGEEVTIYVNPNNPIQKTSGNAFGYIVAGIASGIFFPFIGISAIFNKNRGSNIDKDLTYIEQLDSDSNIEIQD